MARENKRIDLGGQAVIEGVMVKSKHSVNVSVRVGKKIKSTLTMLEKRDTWRYTTPFVRGVFNLFDMLVFGIKALSWSANQQMEEAEEMSAKEMALVMGISMLFGIGIFVVIPFFITRWITPEYGIVFNIVDGVIRIAFFIAYLALISRMEDVQQLFRYHGAEHMAIACQEENLPLTIHNVRKFPTMHRRCGTAFLVIVLLVSIIIFSLISHPSWLVTLVVRLLLIPVVAGVSYEILKFGSRHHDSGIVRGILYPGILLQKITTKKPTDDQIRVAIHSVKAALKAEAAHGQVDR